MTYNQTIMATLQNLPSYSKHATANYAIHEIKSYCLTVCTYTYIICKCIHYMTLPGEGEKILCCTESKLVV